MFDFAPPSTTLGDVCISKPSIPPSETAAIIGGRINRSLHSLHYLDSASRGKSRFLPVWAAYRRDFRSSSSRRGLVRSISGPSCCFGDRETKKYVHADEFVEIRSGDGDEKDLVSEPREVEERASFQASLPSTFDFLELKRELEREGSTSCIRGEEEDNLVPPGDAGSTALESAEMGELVQQAGVKGRRQLMKRSNLLAKQVISIQSAQSLGYVSQLWVNTSSWMVVLVEVRPNLLSGEMEKFLLEDVRQVGDVVLVEDESVVENELKMIGLDSLLYTYGLFGPAVGSFCYLGFCANQMKVKAGQFAAGPNKPLVGCNVVTSGRRNVGKVRGYTFNINSGVIESLELDSFGLSIIPASLVSTYCLLIEDVLEVVSDTVVVHESAISRVQRLTKGIWDAQNPDRTRDEIGEYFEFRRNDSPIHGRTRRKNPNGRKFHRKMRVTEDDWELPMDY